MRWLVLGRWNKQHRLVGDSPLAHVAAVFVTVDLACFGLLETTVRGE